MLHDNEEVRVMLLIESRDLGNYISVCGRKRCQDLGIRRNINYCNQSLLPKHATTPAL